MLGASRTAVCAFQLYFIEGGQISFFTAAQLRAVCMFVRRCGSSENFREMSFDSYFCNFNTGN